MKRDTIVASSGLGFSLVLVSLGLGLWWAGFVLPGAIAAALPYFLALAAVAAGDTGRPTLAAHAIVLSAAYASLLSGGVTALTWILGLVDAAASTAIGWSMPTTARPRAKALLAMGALSALVALRALAGGFLGTAVALFALALSLVGRARRGWPRGDRA